MSLSHRETGNVIKKACKSDIPEMHDNGNVEKGRIYLTSSIMWLITLRPCHMNAFYPMSQIVLWSAENMISTFSEQQSVLTLTSHIWFSSNSIISFILERLLIDSTRKSLTDERFKKRMWKRENILLDQLYKVYQFLFRTADVKEIINHCCKHHTFGPWYSSIRKLRGEKGSCTREVTVGLFLSSKL